MMGISFGGNPYVRHDGVEISGIQTKGSANRVDIRPGDFILAIDDHYLFTVEEVRTELLRHESGSRVKIRYRRNQLIYEDEISFLKAQQRLLPDEKASRAGSPDSRFLTGLSAQLGMTSSFRFAAYLGANVVSGLKPLILEVYAALKAPLFHGTARICHFLRSCILSPLSRLGPRLWKIAAEPCQ